MNKLASALIESRSGIAVRHAAFCAHSYVRRLTQEPVSGSCMAPEGMARVSFGIYSDETDVDRLLSEVCELARCGYPMAAAAPRIASAAPLGTPYDCG